MDDQRWQIWHGTEVEGRFVGMPTIFFHTLPDDNPRPEIAAGFPHAWFCEEWIIENGYDFIIKVMKIVPVVSLEVTPQMLADMPFAVKVNAHLVLDLRVPLSVNQIKPDDDVRLTLANFATYFTPFRTFGSTRLEDYQADAPLYTHPTKGQLR